MTVTAEDCIISLTHSHGSVCGDLTLAMTEKFCGSWNFIVQFWEVGILLSQGKLLGAKSETRKATWTREAQFILISSIDYHGCFCGNISLHFKIPCNYQKDQTRPRVN